MSRLRSLIAICSVSALGLVAGPAVSASGAQPPGKAPAVNRLATNPPPPSQSIVGLGDSYMSGEGVMDSNKNFKEATPNSKWSAWSLAPGPYGGDLVRIPKTPGSSTGSLDTSKQQVKVWGSVFGDKNGWPEWRTARPVGTASPVGEETIPFCDRSQFAPIFIGSGFQPKNLACSGAIVDSKVNDEQQGGFAGFGGKPFKVLKPGIDFKTITAPFGSTPGQAQLLQDYATQQKSAGAPVKVVALSIGGNDFGFADIATKCFTSATFDASSRGNFCYSGDRTQVAKATAGIAKAKAAVTKAVTNVTEAMKKAGYAQDEWTLIYQPPPLPVPEGKDVLYDYSKSSGPTARNVVGGCVLPDRTFDWIAKDVYPKLVGAMTDGLKASKAALGATSAILFDHSQTLAGHRLCEKGTKGFTNYAPKHGRNVPWQADNGIQTEWVNAVETGSGFLSPGRAVSGNKYQKSSALHPNYWGQRALADCMAKAVATVSGTGSEPGSRQVGCTQAASPVTQNAAGRPDMKISAPTTLWISAVGKPTVTGVPHPGRTLTANTQNVFAPADPGIKLSYEWQADGAPIAGATNATYQAVAGDVGKKITVKVSATKQGIDGASATSQPVTVSDILMNTAPTISGTPKVGETLTVNPGAYTPTPDSESFQWLVNGTPIPGATGTTYTPTVQDVKQQIAVTVTATKATFSDLVAKSAAVGPVGFADLKVTGAPTISGKAQVAETLTAEQGTVQFNQKVDSQHYEWFRDGKIIPGADQSTYVLSSDDVGKQITARIIGFKDGHSAESGGSGSLTGSTPVGGGATSGTSAPTAPVAVAPNPHGDSTSVHRDTNTPHTPSIKILRKPKLVDRTADHQHRKLKGKKIRYGTVAEVSLWHVFEFHPSNPKVTWFVKKKGTKKVTQLKNKGLTWEPKKKYIGYKVHAEVTTVDPGYTSETVDTSWHPVVKGKRATVRKPRVRQKANVRQAAEAAAAQGVRPKVGGPLRSTRAVFQPKGKVRYQWYAGKKKIKGATGQVYTPTPAVSGKKLRVQAYVKAGKGYLRAESKSKATAPVRQVKGLG